jgi:hypothetical protein
VTVAHVEHPVQWVTPSPFWKNVLTPRLDATPAQRKVMRQPELLDFDSDDFMQRAQSLLEKDPRKLGALKAQPVSYRNRPPDKDATWEAPIDHLKLYQPAHGHFYLVAASLVCRVPGLPDRLVQPQNGDKVGFVLRRLYGAAGELAWTDAPAAEKGKTWSEVVGDLTRVVETEAVLPLFPMAYADGTRTRRLYVGLIPTSSAESFRNAGVAAVTPAAGDRTQPRTDPRWDELKTKVIDQVDAIKSFAAATTLAQRQEASRFVLLDLADLFNRTLPELLDAITRSDASQLGSDDTTVYNDLNVRADGSTTWRQAVASAWQQADAISGEPNADAPTLAVDLKNSNLNESTFTNNVHAAWQARDEATGSPDPTTVEPVQPFDSPKYDLRGATRYVIRCVYQRPQCGPLHDDVVSDASRAFGLATYFDSDAPARPLHIMLPIDTSVAGLRKTPKSVSFLMSNQLRAQLDRVKDGKRALQQDMDAGGDFDLGMICAFSIPIITICALIVLMIFISLLNIVFWWMPFLKICFPIPLKKGSQ